MIEHNKLTFDIINLNGWKQNLRYGERYNKVDHMPIIMSSRLYYKKKTHMEFQNSKYNEYLSLNKINRGLKMFHLK